MEELFWNKIKQGDEEAFRRLYDDYASLLYGYGMKIAGDDNLVTEAIQSLYVYLFEKRQTISEPKSLSAYLCVALRNTIIAESKRRKKISGEDFDSINPKNYNFELEIDAQTTIENGEVTQANIELVQRELNNLTKQQREVIYLKYYKNLSNQEISDIMGIQLRTVYNTAQSAMTRMRANIKLDETMIIALIIGLCEQMTFNI